MKGYSFIVLKDIEGKHVVLEGVVKEQSVKKKDPQSKPIDIRIITSEIKVLD